MGAPVPDLCRPLPGPFPPAKGFAMLQRLREANTPTFNDDIECTAAVAVAALLGALRLEGVVPLAQQRFLFFGAGQVRPGSGAAGMAWGCG
jgi:malic enzyme